MDLSQEKHRLRSSLQERLAHLSPGDRAAESRSLCKQLLKLLPIEPVTIAAYVPIKDEVDIRPTLEEMLKSGHKLFLPCFENNKLTFRRIENLQELIKGPFQIPEPPMDAEHLDLKELDFVLIPGRGFSREGARIGRGNGGYDKWLVHLREQNASAAIWGIAFEAQLTDQIPQEPHDQKVDGIVTARGLMECG